MVGDVRSVSAQPQPIIASIQVHGNTLTPDQDVIQASGLSTGAPFVDTLLESTAQQLMATKRFQHVDVLKRYASITDPTQIVVLIQVDEGPVHIVPGAAPGQVPRVVRRGPLNVMYLPRCEILLKLRAGSLVSAPGLSGGRSSKRTAIWLCIAGACSRCAWSAKR